MPLRNPYHYNSHRAASTLASFMTCTLATMLNDSTSSLHSTLLPSNSSHCPFSCPPPSLFTFRGCSSKCNVQDLESSTSRTPSGSSTAPSSSAMPSYFGSMPCMVHRKAEPSSSISSECPTCLRDHNSSRWTCSSYFCNYSSRPFRMKRNYTIQAVKRTRPTCSSRQRHPCRRLQGTTRHWHLALAPHHHLTPIPLKPASQKTRGETQHHVLLIYNSLPS